LKLLNSNDEKEEKMDEQEDYQLFPFDMNQYNSN
jgi:hypothetical protein